LKKKLS